MEHPDRNERLNTLVSSMNEALETVITDPEKLLEYMNFARRFNRYSSRNCLLLYHQNKNTTFVASYKQWSEEHQAQVRKGEKSLRILAPIMRKEVIDKTNQKLICYLKEATPEIKTKLQQQDSPFAVYERVVGFKDVPVFDIAQTDFPLERYPELLKDQFHIGEKSSDQTLRLEEGLLAVAKELNIPVTMDPQVAGSKGGFFRQVFRVKNPDKNPDQSIHLSKNFENEQVARVSILSHELGHALLHGKKQGGNVYLNHDDKEYQAEMFAYLICGLNGFNKVESSSQYLKSYAEKIDEKDRFALLDGVQKAVQKTTEIMDRYYEKECTKKALEQRETEATREDDWER